MPPTPQSLPEAGDAERPGEPRPAREPLHDRSHRHVVTDALPMKGEVGMENSLTVPAAGANLSECVENRETEATSPDADVQREVGESPATTENTILVSSSGYQEGKKGSKMAK